MRSHTFPPHEVGHVREGGFLAVVRHDAVVTLTRVPPLKVPAFGKADTVTVRFAVASEHPPVPETVYEICEDPAETPVMFPEPSTLAFPLALAQLPPASPPFTVNAVALPTQTVSVPLSVPASGAVDTVAVTADLLPVVQPPSVAST